MSDSYLWARCRAQTLSLTVPWFGFLRKSPDLSRPLFLALYCWPNLCVKLTVLFVLTWWMSNFESWDRIMWASISSGVIYVFRTNAKRICISYIYLTNFYLQQQILLQEDELLASCSCAIKEIGNSELWHQDHSRTAKQRLLNRLPRVRISCLFFYQHIPLPYLHKICSSKTAMHETPGI